MPLIHSFDSVAGATDGETPEVFVSMVLPSSVSDAGTRTIWITPREAAAYLGVGVETIYDACATGGLKHSRVGHT